MRRWLLAAAACAACLSHDALAQERAPGFLDLIRMIPPEAEVYRGWQLFSYADYRALEAAAGLRRPEAEAPPPAGGVALSGDWPEAERIAWRNSLARIAAGPMELAAYARGRDAGGTLMADAVGIDFFAIDRALVAGNGSLSLLAGTAPVADLDAMATSSLRSRGYALGAAAGVPVWHRFDDGASAFLLSDPGTDAHPFDGSTLAAVRLAVLPDLLVNARTWDGLEAALAMREADGSDLAALIAPMVEAAFTLDGVAPQVLQAWAAPVRDLAAPSAPMAALLQPLTDGTGTDGIGTETLLQGGAPAARPLPAYPVALFLDLQAGDMQVPAIVLPYASLEDAEEAAAIVSERLAQWHPQVPDESLVALVSGTVETRVVEVPDFAAAVTGAFLQQAQDASRENVAAVAADRAGQPGAVAVIAVHHPMPADLSQPLDLVAGTGGPGTLGRIWLAWLQAYANRALTPLAVP